MATLPRVAERAALSLPTPNRIPRTLLAAIALLVVAVVGTLQVLQTSHAATSGYELGRLERERKDLSAQVRGLEAQIAQTAGEGQMRELAMARLGMVPATRPLHIEVQVPSPQTVALPERYVVRPEASASPPLSLWEQLVRKLPGFD